MDNDNSNALRRLDVAAKHIAPNTTAAAVASSSSSSSAAAASSKKGAFEYTVDNDILTLEQRLFYEENGYLLIRGLLKEKDLNLYRQRFIKLCDKEMRDLSIAKKVSKEDAKGEALIAKLQDFEGDEVLFQYCQHPDIIKYVKAFTGPDLKSVHTMFINKPPHSASGGTHPLHQDLHYFPFRPANRIVAAWTAVDKCTVENGCLQVLPTTHKGELLEHGYPEYSVNAAYHGVMQLDKFSHIPRVNAIMEPGDTIFFHPILIHGSGPNSTAGFRKAISCHYASTHCDYVEVMGTSQETIAKEFGEILQKLHKDLDITYTDFWRFKAKLVSGEEDTL